MLIFFLQTQSLLAIDLYVNAVGGLRMRIAADPSAKIMMTIPDGEKVSVLESKGQYPEIVAGREGNWTKVSYQSKEGWVFSGFLSSSMGACISDSQMMEMESVFNLPKLADSGDFYGGTILFRPDGTAKMEASGLRVGLTLEMTWVTIKNGIQLQGTWGISDDTLRQECSFGCQGTDDPNCHKDCIKSTSNKGYSGILTYLLTGPDKGKRTLSNPTYKTLTGPKQTHLDFRATMVSGAEDCIREKK